MPGPGDKKTRTSLMAAAAVIGVMGSAGAAHAALALNLDASDTSVINGGTISNGQVVTSWGQTYGQTVLGGPLTATGTPVWNATGLNGLPTITLDGTGDYLSSNTFGSFIASDNWTVLFVAQTNDTAQANQTVFANPNGFTSAGGGLSLRYGDDVNGWRARFRDPSVGSTSQDSMPYPLVDDDANPGTADRSGGRGEVALRGFAADGTQFLGYYNNEVPQPTALVGLNTTLWDTGSELYIGTRSTLSWMFDGNVSQVVAFDQQLTGADLANVQQALSDKWSLGVNFGGSAAAGNLLLQQAPPQPPPPTLAQYEFEFGITSSTIQDVASRHDNLTNTASDISAGGGNAVVGPGSMISSTVGNPARSLFFGDQRWGKNQTDPPVEPVPGTGTDTLEYLQFSITPDAGHTMDISDLTFDFQRQTEAAIDSILVYADTDASDGVTFSLADQVARADNVLWTDAAFNEQVIDLSSVPALQDVGTEVTFRMYFWRQDSAEGIYQFALDSDLSARLDNLIVNGVVMSALIDGDLNGDDFVGIDDLNIVLINWNQNVTPGDLLQGDPTGEGFVGIDDLNIVLVNWNAGTPPVEGANIPEPATLALLGLGGMAMLRRC